MALPDRARHDVNLNSTLIGVSILDGETPISIWADPTTHALLFTPISSTGSLPSTLRNGQQTLTTSAVVLPSGALTQGVVIEAFSTNIASMWIGNSSLTLSTGYELPAGGTLTIVVSNLNLIYVLGANGTDKVAWAGS